MAPNARLVLLRNSAANLVRGGAAALVALLLPPFLTRSMSPAAFGAWSLVLQLGAYVSFLDFGIQTAVSRFVAHATERNDPEHRDRIVNTSLVILAITGLLAWLGLIVLAFFVPQLFKELPASLVEQVRIALVLVSASLAVGLPASVFTGVFVGLQKNGVPALIIGLSKLLSAALIVVIARRQGSLIQLAIVVCVVNLLSYFALYWNCMRTVPDMRLALKNVGRSAARELIDYCFSLTVWAIAMLMITGLDLTIVGHYRFNEVAYYSIAATIVTFLNGFYNAIISPMLPAAAALHARGDQDKLTRMVTVATRYGMSLLLLTGFPLILGMQTLLRLWVGPSYASHTALIAQILIVANIIRICITPYAVAMIGSGDQRRIILTPLLEGISNLLCSLIAGYYLGAIGVALGTLFGSVVSLIGMIVYNMPRTSIKLDPAQFSRNALIRPSLSILPVLFFELVSKVGPSFSVAANDTLRIAALAFSIFLLWKLGFTEEERAHVLKRFA